MKQIIALFLLTVLLLSLASCIWNPLRKAEPEGSEKESETEQQNDPVITPEDTTAAETDALAPAVILPELIGYWNIIVVEDSDGVDNEFVSFTKDTDGQYFCGFGLWASDFCEIGTVSDVAYDEDGTLTFKVHVPAVPASEMSDGRDAYEYDATVDLSDLSDGIIHIEFGELVGDYRFTGTDMQNGYDAWAAMIYG